jgi:HAD superfamily hydrolase (TIGR01509 family)
MRYRAVILDVDGTLVDSNAAHAAAWAEALAQFGRAVPFDAIRCRIGKGGDKLLKELTGVARESDEGRAIADRRRELFVSRYLPSLQPTPGAGDLLARLHAEGRKMIVASAAEASELEGLLARVPGADLIDTVTPSHEVDRSKPDPDIVDAAIARSGIEKEGAIMIGDTPFDIDAAARSGIPSIAFLSGGWTRETLSGALSVYEHPADLLSRYEHSPLADELP